jgi:peptide chain release factor subunit 1
VDTGYTGREGVKEVVERSREFIRNVRFYEERKIVQDFLYNVGQETGLATYGEREIIQALKANNVRTLLLSEGVRRALVKLRCRDCGYEETRIVDLDRMGEFEEEVGDLSCLRCNNGSYELVEKEDLFEALVKMAEGTEAQVEVISTETEEGEMLKSFGGLGAILKYRQFG